MWQKNKSKIIFKHPRLKIFEDDVILPDGSNTKYLRFAKTHNSVTVICQRNDQKILLLSEYSYPPNKWLLEFPGGSINTKEKPASGANRELMEEGKYYAHRLKLIGKYFINNRRSNAKMYVFYATDLEPKNLPQDHEESFKPEWRSVEELDNMIKKNQITNCHVLAPWSLFKSRCNLKSSRKILTT